MIALTSYGEYRNVGLKYALTVLDLANGTQRWSREGPRGVMNGGHYPRPQIHGGKVWATGASGGVGYNLADGQEPVDRTATNFRCSMCRATPRWLISSQKFQNLETGQAFFTEATRGRCDFGLFPANGLVYASIGDQCCCAAFVRPAAAYAEKRRPAEPWSGERLLKGPAGPGHGPYTLDPKAWPMFPHDGRQAELDHGIYWYGLDPATGQIRKRGRIAEENAWHESFNATRIRAANNPLSTDGRTINLWRSGFVPEDGTIVRFGGTVKSVEPGVTVGGRYLASLLPGVRWGLMRHDRGASYGGITGNLLAFHGDDAFVKDQNAAHHALLMRYRITDWKIRERRAPRPAPLWVAKPGGRVSGREEVISALVYAGGSLLLGSDAGLHVHDADTGEERARPARPAPGA